MSLKIYYNQNFRSDLASLLRGFEPQEHARILAIGHIWTRGGCAQLSQVSAECRPRFLVCLYFTVLADQAMHTHFGFESRRFEELTQYPKFRVGLGHALHMNPASILTTPIQQHLVSEDAVRQIIPEAMTLFVDETVPFFCEHLPEIQAADFFARILADPDISTGRQWTFPSATAQPTSMQELLAFELSRASSGLRQNAHPGTIQTATGRPD
jgi:hypothetical protein